MNNIKDFLEEADEKKAKAKKAKSEEKPKPLTREEEYPDDKVFFALMDQYKQMRRQDRKAASKILDKAQSLKKVSQKARLGAAYL